MRRVIVVAALALVVLATSSASAATYLTADENHVEQLVNSTRASKGAHPLAHQAGLQQMARAQAVRMAERGDIYHNPHLSADITALGVNWRMVGENVGMGPDTDTVYAALLKSPHHYENIIRANYTSFGVGIVNGPGNRIYLVQVFAEIVGAAKPAPAPVVPAPVKVAPRPVAAVHPVATPVRPTPKPARFRTDPNALVGGRVYQGQLPLTVTPR